MANWIGFLTLYKRECWRFLKVWNQTILAPVITTLLFLAVLTLALGGNAREIEHMPYSAFVAPGLVMMALVQNAFANTSSSLIISKMQGVIVDILMPPLSGTEIVLAYMLGGVTRGVLVGIVVMVALSFFVPVSIVHPFWALYYMVVASMMLALLGVLGGLIAQSFDQMAAFTNYVITPLSFLSGTFYSIHALPPMWHALSQYNPFFFMIDGFRYALTGYHEGNLMVGATCLLLVTLTLLAVVQYLFSRGWRLKS